MGIEQMEMDEELANFVYDAYEDDEVFDFQYEFDAPQFFDFTRPETKWESIEADRWFETSRGYPPPPFLMKLKWANDIPVEKLDSFGSSKGREGNWNSNNGSDDSVCCMEPEVSTFDGSKTVQCSPKGMIKPDGKSKGNSSSTLMNPTASHLAKQRKPGEAHNRRSQNLDRSCFQQSATGSQATKRQKLEASYIYKGAYLKQESSFPHKLRKVKPSDVEVPTRTRVTTPKEPHLETANRAQRRLKVDPKTAEQAKSNGHIFKAQPLNRKILEAPSLPLHIKSAPQLPDFHEFRFKTSERALHHTYNNMNSPKLNTKNVSDFSLQLRSEVKVLRRPNSSESLTQERRSAINKLKGGPLSKIINERKLVRDVPTELFSKLSLASEVHEMLKPQPNDHEPIEDMKENNPASIHGENKIVELVKEGMHGYCRKHHQCRNDRVLLRRICSHLYSIRWHSTCCCTIMQERRHLVTKFSLVSECF